MGKTHTAHPFLSQNQTRDIAGYEATVPPHGGGFGESLVTNVSSGRNESQCTEMCWTQRQRTQHEGLERQGRLLNKDHGELQQNEIFVKH